ncbi:MAG: DUF6488 family protein [Terricaulis sp.]
MKNLTRSVLLAFGIVVTSASPALAHPGHGLDDHMSPREIALSSAQYTVQTMVARQILEPSWRDIQPSSAMLRDRNGATEWLIEFRNDAVADATHRRLYVMLTPLGEYIAANYTGQ